MMSKILSRTLERRENPRTEGGSAVKKRLLCLALVLLAALSALTGCAGRLSLGNSDRKIGISMPNDSDSKWATDSEIMHDILVQAGYEVNIQFAGDDAAAQLQQIQDMIGAGCSTIIVAAVDPDSFAGTVDLEDTEHQIIDGGNAGVDADPSNTPDLSPAEDEVNLIAYDTFLPNADNADYYIGFDGYEAGYLQAKCIERRLSLADTGETHTLELFFGDSSDPLAAFQYMGAMEVLQPYLDAGMLEIRSGLTSLEDCAAESAEAARERMDQLLSEEYADGALDAVLCASDALAQAVMAALYEGFTGGVYPVVTGAGCLEANVNALAAGFQTMTLLEDSTGMAQEAARVAIAVAGGDDPEADSSLFNGRIMVPASLFYPEAVYRDNLETLLIGRGYFTRQEDGTLSATGHTSGYEGLLASDGSETAPAVEDSPS